MQSRNWLLPVCAAVFFGLTIGCVALRERAPDPRISEIIAQIDEDQLIATVKKLQAFNTRVFKMKGNELAGDYLFQRLCDINYDSAGYDPHGRFTIDLVSNANSQWAADKFRANHDRYDIGFNKIEMVTKACGSDHTSFWKQGYSAVTTHTESHGPAHTPADTADKVSTAYAKKNAQLGMSVLIELADIK